MLIGGGFMAGFYSQIKRTRWADREFNKLTHDAASLLMFLETGPHTDALRCLFTAGLGQIEDELQIGGPWTRVRIVAALNELSDTEWIKRDPDKIGRASCRERV